MRFMILVKATKDSEAGVMPQEQLIAEMATFHEELVAETKELIAGYTLIQVKSREEAIAWTRRFPNPTLDGGDFEIEVRQLYEMEDFGPSEAVERFREIGVGSKENTR